MRAAVEARARTAAYRSALLLMRGWWVVRRPRSSGVRCILRAGERFVLVRHSYGDRRWMLPGGRMRGGEDAVTTARREMSQELGITCRDWRVVGDLPARSGYRRRSWTEPFRRHSTFYVEGRVRGEELEPRAGELSHAGWFAPHALPADCSESIDVAAAKGWLASRGDDVSAPGLGASLE